MKILIADDERSGRVTMEHLLKKLLPPGSYHIGIASTLESTQEMLAQGNVDILFLDINFKGVSSFEIMSSIPKSTAIVFVTAYAEHTIRAIRNQAFDYLLKPVREDELRECLDRYMSAATELKQDKLIQIREKGANRRIRVSEINYIKGHGPYSVIHMAAETITMARTLKSFQEEFGEPFVRAHKSYLVNRNFIQRFQHNKLILENNVCLPISRSGLKNL